jgi:protoporphyrinogen/coproporphyrinogen III oxidase
MQDAVVVGAGIAGLSAAWALRDHDVIVLEAGSRIGGRIRSERRGDYWLNLGAHVFGGADTATGRLMAEAGVASEPVPGVLTAVSMQGKLVASGPVESYPFRLPLSFSDRVATIRSGMKLRRAVARYDRAARPRKGEHHNARRDRMLAFLGDETFSSFIGPLPAGVEALYRPTITRSSGELDELAAGHGVGYFHLVWRKGEGLSRNVLGGSSLFTHALARPLGGRLLTDAPVQEVIQHKDRVVVRFRRGDREDEIEARAVALATPAYVTAAVAKALPAETVSALESIPYGPYVVVALLTGEPEATRWDGVYAIATPGRAFNMIFNLANVVRGPGARRPGGSLMLYSGGRRLAAPLLKLTDEEIVERYLTDLDEVFPEARSMVVEAIVQRWPRALPYPYPGRYRIQPALDRPLGRIALAGDYLGNLYTETSIQTGVAAAEHALSTLGFAGDRAKYPRIPHAT